MLLLNIIRADAFRTKRVSSERRRRRREITFRRPPTAWQRPREPIILLLYAVRNISCFYDGRHSGLEESSNSAPNARAKFSAQLNFVLGGLGGAGGGHASFTKSNDYRSSFSIDQWCCGKHAFTLIFWEIIHEKL